MMRVATSLVAGNGNHKPVGMTGSWVDKLENGMKVRMMSENE
jgi:hypothetical protein